MLMKMIPNCYPRGVHLSTPAWTRPSPRLADWTNGNELFINFLLE